VEVLNLIHMNEDKIGFADVLFTLYFSVGKDEEAVMFAGKYAFYDWPLQQLKNHLFTSN